MFLNVLSQLPFTLPTPSQMTSSLYKLTSQTISDSSAIPLRTRLSPSKYTSAPHPFPHLLLTALLWGNSHSSALSPYGSAGLHGGHMAQPGHPFPQWSVQGPAFDPRWIFAKTFRTHLHRLLRSGMEWKLEVYVGLLCTLDERPWEGSHQRWKQSWARVRIRSLVNFGSTWI